jgi:putative transcriptional regulator
MMDLHELLPLYALGVLAPEEVAAVERALREQPHLAHDVAEYRATTGELASMLTPIKPSAHVRQRLMSSVGGGRFEKFLSAFGRIFDVTAEAGREVLAWIEDPTKWEVMNPTCRVIHFPAGPACAGADTGIVCISPGGTFPYHGHSGIEITLVLAGAALGSDGRVLRAGDEITEEPGHAHELTNTGDGDFIYASRVYGLDYNVPKPS